MNEQELAKVREQLLLTPEEFKATWGRPALATPVLRAQQDKDLNTPIKIEGGICLKCKGTGWGQFNHNCKAHCDDCHGTGKQTIEFTLNSLVEEKLR